MSANLGPTAWDSKAVGFRSVDHKRHEHLRVSGYWHGGFRLWIQLVNATQYLPKAEGVFV